MSRVFRWIAIAAVTFFVLLFLLVNGAWVIELPFQFAIGWIFHVRSVAPRVTVNLAGIALFALALPVAAWLAHGTARWLWNDADRPWRWKWTATGLAAVMLMFVSGVAATGVVHQAGWLIRSPVPLVESSWKARLDREIARCESNVRQIAQAMSRYAAANGGYVPIDQADLVRIVASQGGEPGWFVCGDGRFGPMPTTASTGWVDRVSEGDRFFTYRYFRQPIAGPDGKRRVRLVDREIHHYGGQMGLVVLYEDGDIETLDRESAKAWLKDGFALTPEFPTSDAQRRR